MPSFHDIVATYIWPVCGAFALFSVTIFMSLVLARYFTDTRKNKSEVRKKEIEQRVSQHIETPLDNINEIIARNKRDFKYLAEVIPPLLREIEGDVRYSLLATLKDVGFYDWLINELSHYRSKHRHTAAVTLARHWPDENVKEILRYHLTHSHPLVKQSAIVALATTQDVTQFPAVARECKQLGIYSYPIVCDVFQKFGPGISKNLVTLLESENISLETKMAALMALGQMGNPEHILKAAIPLYNHPHHQMRALSFRALAHAKAPVPVELLHFGMSDAYWRVKRYVVDCAANTLPLPEDVFITMMEDENWLIGLQVGFALFSAGMPGIALLHDIAKNPTRGGHRAQMLLAEKGAYNGLA
ncbi:MAG: HEAT repeat domain-containing protein [Hyphomicrobiales bacterium]|nr:HEAT repeat domain-containing protein [Rickettsiales bacterium]MCP5361153.1 HEAT repeat domain-containing protein [Hyphomicrobiales bacterium]